ncbi:unnamed protein product [Medioppia subpectinata]|uniref:Peptidase C1A papain C-terminal domain-containing protein n=1 Tax=Medioppia subpectinata TaxID=1979941 RepID=A0A7R9PZK4_9ACAR|nr:unnamed protein product [Medioppia subpectinata]CAG2106561.1 unnamed protein product [Medioppia subpectinata]
MKTGKLVTLSVQNLVDCPVYRLYNMSTCTTGNYMHHAFEYVMANGIDTDQSYPYIDGDNYKCLYDKRTVGATISGYVNITTGDELEMQRAVATVGPVTVGIDATTDGFRFYKSGVYKDTKHECKGQYFDELHHAVTAVGYGTENGIHYWLLRNSYTTSGNCGEDCPLELFGQTFVTESVFEWEIRQ